MKTVWHGTSIIAKDNLLKEIYYCSSCPSNCRLVLPLAEEPPIDCVKKEVRNESHLGMQEMRLLEGVW